MSTRTCGLVWRKASSTKKGQYQLLTIKLDGRFMWTHGLYDNTQSTVWPKKELEPVLYNCLSNDGAYWIGPEEMSGWEDDN